MRCLVVGSVPSLGQRMEGSGSRQRTLLAAAYEMSSGRQRTFPRAAHGGAW